MLSQWHITSIVITLFLVTLVGIYSLRKVKNSSDFAVGGHSIGTTLVAGTIAGTMIGGASTIGTAQLAFQYGFSAWWFTLGAGISSIILGLFLATPLRRSGASTGPGFLAQTYGEGARTISCIFSSMGIFLNIIGNILAATALLTSILPISPFPAACLSVLLIISYVIFGGVWGTGLVGLFKLLVIYASMIYAGFLAYQYSGGWSGLSLNLPSFPYMSLFGRGLGTDLASAFSLLVGVISTQTYLQAVFAGRNVAASRNGALVAGLIIPWLGLAGIVIGLYMKINYPFINPAEALPLFFLKHLQPWVGGVALTALLISSIGTGAGLTLGVSTMLVQDIYKKLISPQASDKNVLLFSRLSIILVAAFSLIFLSGNLNSLILKWSFLSMALRGATICFPLLFAIFLRGYVTPRAGTLAIAIAPTGTILWAIFGQGSLDPLYIGLALSLGILLLLPVAEKRFTISG